MEILSNYRQQLLTYSYLTSTKKTKHAHTSLKFLSMWAVWPFIRQYSRSQQVLLYDHVGRRVTSHGMNDWQVVMVYPSNMLLSNLLKILYIYSRIYKGIAERFRYSALTHLFLAGIFRGLHVHQKGPSQTQTN